MSTSSFFGYFDLQTCFSLSCLQFLLILTSKFWSNFCDFDLQKCFLPKWRASFALRFPWGPLSLSLYRTYLFGHPGTKCFSIRTFCATPVCHSRAHISDSSLTFLLTNNLLQFSLCVTFDFQIFSDYVTLDMLGDLNHKLT